jgi:hypothetical protein
MKKYILFAPVMSLLYACATDSNVDISDEDPYNGQRTAFQYSIIIRDSVGIDLLDKETIGYYMKSYINIISPTQENVKEQTWSVEKYDNEYRIVVKVECDEETWDSHVETILELCVLWPGRTVPDGIYTFDTIRCGTGMKNDCIICNDITVNGLPAWKRTRNDEEPYIELEREYCQVAIMDMPPR